MEAQTVAASNGYQTVTKRENPLGSNGLVTNGCQTGEWLGTRYIMVR